MLNFGAAPRALDRAKTSVLIAGLAAILLAVTLGPTSWQLRPSGLLRDFNAFYCAGTAIAAHADPYLAEPLGTCERMPKPWGLSHQIPHLSMPAPLPPYALAPFVVLAHLPYGVAALAWLAISLACVLSAAWALRALTGLPLAGTVASLALVDGFAAMSQGQVVPVAVAGIAWAAWALSRERYALAALCAAAAMIEPHVGLPACLALFLFVPRTRGMLAACGVACAALSLGLVGFSQNAEYLHAVIPAHALSELVNEKQLSLTYLAHQLGASDALALRLGSLSYLVMLAAGLAAAKVLAERLETPALLAALPVAFTLVGGPFVHAAQMAAAIPATTLMYAALPRGRAALGAALGLIAVPWVQFANLGPAFPLFVALAILALAWSLGVERPLAVAALAGGAALLSAVPAVFFTAIPDPTAALATAYEPGALAEKTWDVFVHAIAQSNGVAYTLAKVPTWLGLLALASISLGETFRAGAIRRQEHLTATR